MRIKTLALTNFRNFSHVEEILFPPVQNILVVAAPNATGKTNFLEAVHFLLRGKSFRALPHECVRWGEDYFQLGLRTTTKKGDSFLAAQYVPESRTLRLTEDEHPVSIVTFYRDYPFVMFLPEDSFLFVRGPAGRRNFLNSILITSPVYLAALVQFHRVLRQRNAALKKASSPQEVVMWTQLLLEHAKTIWDQRQALVEFINAHVPDLFRALGGGQGEVVTELVMGAPQENNDLLKAFERVWKQESRYQYTMYGPHRDELQVLYDGHHVKTALSRGQMRLLVLALKIVAWQYMKQLTQEDPLLLVDEVFSELDEERQRLLFEHLPVAQTIVTCTAIPQELRRREDVHMLDLRTILQPTPIPVAAQAIPVGVR